MTQEYQQKCVLFGATECEECRLYRIDHFVNIVNYCSQYHITRMSSFQMFVKEFSGLKNIEDIILDIYKNE